MWNRDICVFIADPYRGMGIQEQSGYAGSCSYQE
jgi:hypothetical protein